MSIRLSHQAGDFLDPHTGQYQIQNLISSGGMGTVYQAVDTFTGAAKAVKECDILDDPRRKNITRAEAVSIFLDEARCLEDLKHPGIPGGSLHPVRQQDLRVCLQCGNPVTAESCQLCMLPRDSLYFQPTTIDYRYYLVMEYVDGTDLSQAVARLSRPLSRQDVAQIFEWLLEAARILEYVHRRKLAHCDVKPENLRIRKDDGQLFLLDFGLQRLESDSQKTKVLIPHRSSGLGTKGYAAPEQERGAPTYASDTFALAMTALSVLTGLDPSHPLDIQQLRQYRASHWIPTLLPAIDDLLYQSLAIEPGDRPDAKAWIRALSVADPTVHPYMKSGPLAPSPQQATAALDPQLNRGALPPLPAPDPVAMASGKRPPKIPKPAKVVKAAPSLRLARLFAPLLQLCLVGVVLYSVWFFLLRPNPSDLEMGRAQPDARIYDVPNGTSILERLHGGERLSLRKTTSKVKGYWFRVEQLDGKPAHGYIQRDGVQLEKPREPIPEKVARPTKPATDATQVAP